MTHVAYKKKSFLKADLLMTCSFLTGLFACTPVVKIMGYSLYIWCACLLILLAAVFIRLRPRLTTELGFFLAAVITFVLTNGALSSAYADNNFKGLIAIAIASIAGFVLVDRGDCSTSLIRGVLFGAKLNVIWIFVQTFFTAVLSLDLNDLVFVQMLHTVAVASQAKASGIVSTGLCWNAGGIAAALMIAFMLEEKQGWKVAILIAGLLTQSSTLIVGLGLCLLWKLGNRFKTHRQTKFSHWLIFSLCVIVAFGSLCVIAFEPLQQSLGKVVGATIDRFMMLIGNTGFDSSAVAHFDYYNNIPLLSAEMTSLQYVFGYGIDCSGMPYTALTNQYFWLDSWFVESDPVNTFLGMGLLGVVTLYVFLVQSAIKAFRINRDVGFLMVVFIVCGYFYDIQSVAYYWLLTAEMALIGMVANGSSEGLRIVEN